MLDVSAWTRTFLIPHYSSHLFLLLPTFACISSCSMPPITLSAGHTCQPSLLRLTSLPVLLPVQPLQGQVTAHLGLSALPTRCDTFPMARTPGEKGRAAAKAHPYSRLMALGAPVKHLVLSSADTRRARQNNIIPCYPWSQPLASGKQDGTKPDWEANANSSDCPSGNFHCLQHVHVWHTQVFARAQVSQLLWQILPQNKSVLTLALQDH